MTDRDFMRPGRSVAISGTAMAATSHPAATLAALEILRAGGNAVDAGIAAVALQGVVEPQMTGIGGDCFALYAPAGGPVLALNGSGRAPKAATCETVAAAEAADRIGDTSVHAVTVPGAVAAWAELSAKHGRLGLDRVLQPAIAAARDGYVVTPRVARDWSQHADRVGLRRGTAAVLLRDGRPPAPGDRMADPAQARTLERVAAQGASGFYDGPVAADMVATLRDAGGLHTEEDFASTRPLWTDPISASYRGQKLIECPPNGQGLAALVIARILDGFDLSEGALGDADRIHLLAEATKAAYRMRDTVIADPQAMQVQVDDVLSDATINSVRTRILMHQASDPVDLDMPLHRDTVCLSVVDSDGNALSLINSIFQPFGSGIYAPAAGVLLQNRGCGFSLSTGHPNVIGPGKLPFHTIIPGMLADQGEVVMSFGVMGGQYQATGHVHLLSQILDRGLDPQAASDRPRSFCSNGVLRLEPTISPQVRADLEARGHRTAWAEEPLGGCQAIWIDRTRGVLLGASDHRKDGVALGY